MPYLDHLEYHLISDGISWMDGGGAFGLVPKLIWADLFPPDEKNRVPIIINSLLIRSGGQTILVDTGYGDKLSDKMRRNMGLDRPEGDLLAGLARLGVQPEEIDIVLNTHLHLDHCGGNTRREGDRLVPTFPNAEYWIQRLELADAAYPNERTRATYLPENYLPLAQSGHLKIIDGGVRLTDQLRTAITPGHTRAHQVVILESGPETAIFMGDMATFHYHFQRLAWVTGYDIDPLQSIETKRYWQQWALRREALLIFQHDIQLPFGKLIPDGKRYRVEPVESQGDDPFR